MAGFEQCATPEDAVAKLALIYQRSVSNLRSAIERFAKSGEPPTAIERAAGAFVYPELRIHYRGLQAAIDPQRAFARLSSPGTYSVSITRPDLFRAYLLEQLGPLVADFGVTIEVGLSSREIPYPYVIDAAKAGSSGAAPRDLARHFPTTHLATIGDELCDGRWVQDPVEPSPLALFDAPRVDFSLARLQHYTGTPPEHFQKYILFTNYHRYVDEIVRYAAQELKKGGPYQALSCAGGSLMTRENVDSAAVITDSAWRRHQMPAYHLMAENREGFSLVNIGVGPSNAKTITDHLAVLRPEAWLMIGHCGGLRASQTIGDYVLAHAYLRDDGVLDDVLPREIPIPAIAEIQQALQMSAAQVTGESVDTLKRRLRTGTVVTTADRNWELRYQVSALRFNQSRAVAIDMESATIAGQGYRFRVPYGTLLCVSDKPLHGEIKLPGQANRFYERAVEEHIRIGIAAVAALKEAGPRLHSRKLRSFDEPPFR